VTVAPKSGCSDGDMGLGVGSVGEGSPSGQRPCEGSEPDLPGGGDDVVVDQDKSGPPVQAATNEIRRTTDVRPRRSAWRMGSFAEQCSSQR